MNGAQDDLAVASDHAPAFIPGLELNARFFTEVVAPLLAAAFPRLRYSAALIGYGSEVLGYDTPRSTDHEWGPRLWLLVSDEDDAASASDIRSLLARWLPPTFRGFSTHYGPPGSDGVRQLAPAPDGPIDHKVEVCPARGLLTSWLGVDPFEEMTAADWLTIPQQKLLEVTAGRVYHDGLGVLEPIRAKLAYYPRDVWLYLLATQWGRISQQEAFVGRAGEVGDELGSALVAAALVRDLMGLCFLIERRYAPYSKWFGTAFAELDCAPRLAQLFARVLGAESWPEREAALSPAYEFVAAMHNALGVTPALDPRVRPYHGRPFQVLFAERFADATAAAIEDQEVRAIVERAGLIGSLDQVSDEVDTLFRPERVTALRSLYAIGR
jgi:hypothetical protein